MRSRTVVGAAALIAVLTVVSRLAGFGRTTVFAWTVGATDLGDTYLAANTLPNIVFELVAGGALAGLVVPLLAGPVERGDRERAGRITSALLGWVLVLLIPVAVVVAVAAGPLTRTIMPAATPAELETGARMLCVFAPQLPLYGVGVVLTGVLQAHRRFAWPVIAPLLSSVTVIGVYLAFGGVEGAGTGIADVSRTGELILSVGTTCGVVVLSGCLLFPVAALRLPLRPTLRLPEDARARVLRLGWAGLVTVGAQQLALLVVIGQASGGPAGTTVLFNLAQTVFLLPWAVLAVPLATAAYPGLSTADDAGYRSLLARTARQTALASCLGAAGITAVAIPAAALLTGGGALAGGIVAFAPGLIGYGLFALLSRALYARGRTAAAAGATAAAWALVAVLALGLSAATAPAHRVLVLGLAHSAGMLVLGVLMLAAVRRTAGPDALAGLGRTLPAGLLAAVAAGAAGYAVAALTDPTPAPAFAVLQGMLCGFAGLAVFLGVALVLDRDQLVRLARRGGARTGSPASGTLPDGEDDARAPARDGGDRR
ncbi:murein biosynthesis integral membrane protein MurJ [Catenuloplanes atrovinosus]|uniref:Peptidoglycan lipid II flippase n=1 Tax=Catenuloplanes atrovinosus TaxID=137266 RepID=A0AAE3YIK5_9ACTN|nr:lipid II flippase MurJ [Catenuloplanes atrovinosus]MDR7274384.1 putative peptidoglycan lipid II flippase [Catenuloplanes atrovinosus]